jgi:hypothetical protein
MYKAHHTGLGTSIKLFAAAGQVRGYMEVKLCPVAQIEGLLL